MPSAFHNNSGFRVGLIPDLSAWAHIPVDRRESALVVPAEAVRAEAGAEVVFVRNGSRFERRPVEVGLARRRGCRLYRACGPATRSPWVRGLKTTSRLMGSGCLKSDRVEWRGLRRVTLRHLRRQRD